VNENFAVVAVVDRPALQRFLPTTNMTAHGAGMWYHFYRTNHPVQEFSHFQDHEPIVRLRGFPTLAAAREWVIADANSGVVESQ
jgi:hypothetical protein